MCPFCIAARLRRRQSEAAAVSSCAVLLRLLPFLFQDGLRVRGVFMMEKARNSETRCLIENYEPRRICFGLSKPVTTSSFWGVKSEHYSLNVLVRNFWKFYWACRWCFCWVSVVRFHHSDFVVKSLSWCSLFYKKERLNVRVRDWRWHEASRVPPYTLHLCHL